MKALPSKILKIILFFASTHLCAFEKINFNLPKTIPLFQKNYTISHNDAVVLAYHNRKDLKSYLYARRANKNSEYAALAPYFPQIQLSFKGGKTAPGQLFNYITDQEQLCPDSTTSRNASFYVSQLIYDGGIPILDYRIAKVGTKIIDEQRQNTKNTIRANVELSFLETQRTLLQKKFIEEKNISSKRLFDLKAGKNAVGFLNKSDWLLSAAQYASDQADVANYEYNIQTALANLQRETATPILQEEINLSLQDTVMFDLKSLDFYLHAARRFRPDLKIQKHSIKQARLQKKKFSRKYLPQIYAYAEASDYALGTYKNSTSNWSMGVDVSWSFDGLASAHRSQQYENTELENQLLKRDLELQIIKEVKEAHYQVKILINSLKAAQFELEQSFAAIALKQKEFEIGAISQNDYAQAQLDLEITQFSFNSLKIDVASSYQNLLFACGYPKEKNKQIRL